MTRKKLIEDIWEHNNPEFEKYMKKKAKKTKTEKRKKKKKELK